MKRLLYTVLGFLGLLLLAPAVQAEQRPDRNCKDDRGVDRCAADQHRRVLGLFGLKSIESHHSAGESVRRVFYVDGYGRDLVAISFVRRPGHDPVMQVHLPRGGGEQARPPMEAAVSEVLWDEVSAASQHFDRKLEPLPTPPSGQVRICGHSWVYTIEATDPAALQSPARQRRTTEDACTGGLAQQFASFLAARALPLLPHCAALDPAQHRNPPSQLRACSLLSGDRLAAADAFNAADGLRFIDRPEELVLVQRLFQVGATLDWAGEGTTSKAGAAPRLWTAQVTGPGTTNLFLTSAHGERFDRVRIQGFFSRAFTPPGQDESIYTQAPVEQIWVRGLHGIWQIERATVGAFKPSRPG